MTEKWMPKNPWTESVNMPEGAVVYCEIADAWDDGVQTITKAVLARYDELVESAWPGEAGSKLIQELRKMQEL